MAEDKQDTSVITLEGLKRGLDRMHAFDDLPYKKFDTLPPSRAAKPTFSGLDFEDKLKGPLTLRPADSFPPLDQIVRNLSTVRTQGEQQEHTRWDTLFDISGNVAPENAKLTYLCEPDHRSAMMTVIDQYLQFNAKPGDIVLLEGHQAGEQIDGEKVRYGLLPEGVELLGWDDMELVQEGKRLYDELDRITSELKNSQIPDEEKQTLRIYKTGDLLPRIQQVVIIQRNQKLREYLDKLRVEKPNARVFVITGEWHMEKDPALREYSEEFPYVVLTVKL